MTTVTLKRVEPGRYESSDGKHVVYNLNDPSGAPHAKIKLFTPWLVKLIATGEIVARCYSLSHARSVVNGRTK